jgi:hypothetical protein
MSTPSRQDDDPARARHAAGPARLVLLAVLVDADRERELLHAVADAAAGVARKGTGAVASYEVASPRALALARQLRRLDLAEAADALVAACAAPGA